MQADITGPLQLVFRGPPPAQYTYRSLLGLHTPVQELGIAATAGVELERTRKAGMAIARPPIARLMNVRRVLGEPKRARDPGSSESGPG
jgi:hypothetical protein